MLHHVVMVLRMILQIYSTSITTINLLKNSHLLQKKADKFSDKTLMIIRMVREDEKKSFRIQPIFALYKKLSTYRIT